MDAQLDETQLLIAFARAAAKAQEIEALFQEMLIASEVAADTKNRSFEEIAVEIEKLPLGVLNKRYFNIVKSHINDPRFFQIWKELNEDRIFLMHRFFNVFPLTSTDDKLAEAGQRIAKIDALLDSGRRFLKQVRDRTYAGFNIPPAKFREFLKFVIDHRKKGLK
jgi:hypothetical protein